jgi:hypothetical protein
LTSANGVFVPTIDPTTCMVYTDGVSRIELEYDAVPEDVAYQLLRLRRAAEDVFFEVPVANRLGDSPYALGRVFENTICSRAPELEPGVTYCASLTAYDVSGNAAGAESEHCFTTTLCEPAPGDFAPACVPATPQEPGGCAAGRGRSPGLPLCALFVGLWLLWRLRGARGLACQ